ncbi:MAG: type III pantothenate kinase [Alphaproteobacteria bacterium]|nr:type III pantothenate kinase [Alphaproteobacteria bacterium]
MLLTIDAGNTNIVFALFDEQEGRLRTEWRIATDHGRTADEYVVWLDHLLSKAELGPDDVTGAIISTVVPQALFNLKTLCKKYFRCEPMVVGETDLDLGLKVKARDVGSDRLVNAVAAHMDYAGPLIVLDFGTATTFDVVDEDGSYMGGIIAPGINLSLQALHMAAAKLPHIAVARPEKVIGTDTVSAMQSGVFWGYVDLIDGLASRIAKEYGKDMTVIATGGLARLFADATESIQHVDYDLTLRGLYEIYRRNRGA